MKPFLLLQHNAVECGGYFLTFCRQHEHPLVSVRADLDLHLPQEARRYAGIIVMGGAQSANDQSAHMRAELALLEDAVRHDIPVLGHCLGGQILARVLGAEVSANPKTEWEIGWFPLQTQNTVLSHEWFGALDAPVLHWHRETFSVPSGSHALLASEACAQQAFVYGPHLAMQFHIEANRTQVETWTEEHEAWPEYAALSSVQSPCVLLADLTQRLAASEKMAEHVYTRWMHALVF